MKKLISGLAVLASLALSAAAGNEPAPHAENKPHELAVSGVHQHHHPSTALTAREGSRPARGALAAKG